MFWKKSVFGLLAFAVAVGAAPSVETRADCANTAKSRNCWGRFDINTDYYEHWPNTGNTVEHHWTISREIRAPDGYERSVFTINGQFPGPTLEANWGDNIVVHVTNALPDNGTSIHWHGIRQLNSVHADGAVAITQCPIAPGDTFTYRFKATQYGTGWYHSHFSMQYSDGLLGAVVIHGPSSANWDIDVGPVIMMDWFHNTAFALEEAFLHKVTGISPPASNGLVNGMSTFNCDLLDPLDKNCVGGGKYWETIFVPGKKHRLRLINTGSDVMFRFSIDGHKLKVIAMDFVPIVPYETDAIFIEANQTPGDYWLRATPQLACLVANLNQFKIRGIVRYSNFPSIAEPKTKSRIYIDRCEDEPSKNLVPVVAHTVGEDAYEAKFALNLLPDAKDKLRMKWIVNTERFESNSSLPTLQLVDEDAEYPDGYLVTEISVKNKWVYFQIRSLLTLPHPVHFHGHDIYLLSKGAGFYLGSTISPLGRDNPPRRDTIVMPALGHLIFAFKTDNPGSWLLHCHIAWHLSQGFAMQVVTRPDEVTLSAAQSNEMERVCQNWREYDPDNGEKGV